MTMSRRPLACLVASDLSARSDRALVRAFRLAGRSGGRVTVLHVVEESYPAGIAGHLAAEAEAELTAQVAAMPESADVAWRVAVARGHDYEQIADVATADAVDLLVLGGRREPKIADLFLSSTAQRVVRRSPVPVLVVKRPYDGPWRSALAAVDGSEHARRAVAFALDAFADLRVTAFHAVAADQPPRLAGSASRRTEAVTLTPEAEAAVRRPLEALDGFAGRGTVLAVAGYPIAVLDDLVDTRRPDLVLCGRSRSARSFFLGEDLPGHAMLSVARDLLVMP